MNSNNEFKLFIDDITENQACVNWVFPRMIYTQDLETLTITLFKDGSSLSYESVNQAKFGP